MNTGKTLRSTYLDNSETIWSVSVGIPRVHLEGDLVFPAELLHLLPGRVGVGQQELDTDARLEALPGGGGP